MKYFLWVAVTCIASGASAYSQTDGEKAENIISAGQVIETIWDSPNREWLVLVSLDGRLWECEIKRDHGKVRCFMFGS